MALDWTPIHLTDPVLHQAAYIGDQKSVQVLLCDKVHFASINVRNRLGCTPLRLAATGGHTECVRCLIKAGAIIDLPDVKAQTPLYVAVKNKHVNCARALLEAGANPNGDSNSLCTPLYIAAMEGFAAGVRVIC
jgi:ankyrin repeat protein